MTTLEASDSLMKLLRRPGIRQFAKFCIVGASSTAISAGIFTWLVYGIQLDQLLHHWLAPWPAVQALFRQYDLYLQVAALGGFFFAVTNGFFWNNRWTFRHDGPGAQVRYAKFIAVNVIGLILNQTILFVVNGLLTAGRPHSEKGLEPLIAFAVATGIVVFWNFLANKYWTFKS